MLIGAYQEHAGSFREAVKTYQSLLPHISNPQSVLSKSREYRLWTERLLVRYCVLVWRHVKSKSQTLDELLSPASLIGSSLILPPFRTWAKMRALEPDDSLISGDADEAIPARRRIWKIYYHILSILLQLRRSYKPTGRRGHTVNEATKFEFRFLFDSREAQYAELRRVETAYETLLLNEVSFPKANEPNREIENWVDQVMSNWVLVNDSDWEDSNTEQGGKAAVSRRVLAVSFTDSFGRMPSICENTY